MSRSRLIEMLAQRLLGRGARNAETSALRDVIASGVPDQAIVPPEAPTLRGALSERIGRASDGSILPVRPPEPMRQSFVGGSDDLVSATRMQPDAGGARREVIDVHAGGHTVTVIRNPSRADLMRMSAVNLRERGERGIRNILEPSRSTPDGGGAQIGSASLDDLRAQGFDIEAPLYRGSTADEVTLEARESGHKPVGPAVHLSPRADVASDYASREGGNVTRYYVRGPLATMDQWNEAMAAQPTWNVKTRGWAGYDEHVAETRIAAQRTLQARGFTGVRGQIAGLGYGADEVAVFNPTDIVLANPTRAQPNAGNALQRAIRDRMEKP